MKLVDAYDEVSLSRQGSNNPQSSPYQNRVYNDTVQGSGYSRYGGNNKRPPLISNIGNGGKNYSGDSMSNATYTKYFRTPQNEKHNYGNSRYPSESVRLKISNEDNITETSRRTEKLSDVFTQSDDTTEFIKNLKTVIGSSIPDYIYYLILFCLSIFGVVCILVASFNFPFCRIEEMISVYLLVSGLLTVIFTITLSMQRCCVIPKRQLRLRKMKALNSHTNNRNVLGEVCISGVNVIIFIVIIVWTILGCIWVFGNIQYVHYSQGMFEEHYCDAVLYRTAFASVSLYLIIFATLLLSMAGLMCYGLSKTK
uniref:G_PROTEIN_RECEP_F3_4 domain-containing protein n=1 Tax=Strongyloides papillosus TaxID=174720 RepID=A0A0N5BIB6_STREA